MNLIEIKEMPNISDDIRLKRVYDQLREFLKELEKKKLTHKIIDSINHDIDELNSTSLAGNELRNLLKKKQRKIIKVIEKELKIVPKNYYRNLWLILGMSGFGLPIGVSFGANNGNMGLLGLGLPIGLAIGIAIGSGMDKKAFEEGR